MIEFACLPRFAAAGILAAFLSLGAGGAAKALYDVSSGTPRNHHSHLAA
jgi:hypothetical protein